MQNLQLADADVFVQQLLYVENQQHLKKKKKNDYHFLNTSLVDRFSMAQLSIPQLQVKLQILIFVKHFPSVAYVTTMFCELFI